MQQKSNLWKVEEEYKNVVHHHRAITSGMTDTSVSVTSAM